MKIVEFFMSLVYFVIKIIKMLPWDSDCTLTVSDLTFVCLLWQSLFLTFEFPFALPYQNKSNPMLF